MSSRRYSASFYLAILVVVFYRNSNHWLRVWTNVNTGGTAYVPCHLNLPRSNYIQNEIPDHVRNITIELENTIIPCSIYYARDDDNGDSGGSSDSQGPEQQAEGPDESLDEPMESTMQAHGHAGAGSMWPRRRGGCDPVRHNIKTVAAGLCLALLLC